MPETVLSFVVRVPDRQTVTAFTPHTVAADLVTATLQKAAAEVQGSKVVPADYVAHVDTHGDRNQYVFGTGGMLKFSEPQSIAVLRMAADAVVRALLADHFGIYGDPEIEPG